MINYHLGDLQITLDCYGYLYFGNFYTHVRVADNYFRFFHNVGDTSFFRLEIFTDPEEINYEILFRKVLSVTFHKSFNVGKFYFTFVSNV